MYIYTIQCTHHIYGCSQPCLTLLTSCTLVTCNNYIIIRINLITNQQLFCNKCMPLSNTYDHAIGIHFYYLIYMTFQLKIWNLNKRPFKQMTHGSVSTNMPQCINDLHALTFIVKKFKTNLKKTLCIKTFCVFPSFMVMWFSYHVL
jgi:hypothetical protein